MSSQIDRAIVLKSILFEERHRIVTALTLQNGLVTALAKNSVQSRRFGGSLDLFSVSEWRLQPSRANDFFSLNESSILKSFDKIRQDYTKLTIASFFCELITRVAPQHQAADDLFKMTYHGLDLLDNTESELHLQRALNAFTLRVLHWSGTSPRLGHCLDCQKSIATLSTLEVSMDVSRGGWTCPTCSHNSFALISTQMVKDFLFGMAYPIKQSIPMMDATLEEHKDGFAHLKQLLEFHVPGLDKTPLRTLKSFDLERSIERRPENSLRHSRMPTAKS